MNDRALHRSDDADALEIIRQNALARRGEHAFRFQFFPQIVVRFLQRALPHQLHRVRHERQSPVVRIHIRMAVQDHFHSYLERDAAQLIVPRPHDRVERPGILLIFNTKIHMAACRALELRDLADDPRRLRLEKYIEQVNVFRDGENFLPR